MTKDEFGDELFKIAEKQIGLLFVFKKLNIISNDVYLKLRTQEWNTRRKTVERVFMV